MQQNVTLYNDKNHAPFLCNEYLKKKHVLDRFCIKGR